MILRKGIWITLAVSFVLRVVLAVHGGQWFWPDEGRYQTSQIAARRILEGHWVDAGKALFPNSEHLLFKVIALGPALIEQAFKLPGWAPAIFFAACSTWVLWLIGRLASRAGGGEREQLAAVLLAASSSCLFYYSRHLVPYDLAIGLSLAAMVLGLGAGGTWQSLACGMLACGAFLTYNGYWALAAAPIAVHVIAALPGWRSASVRLALAVVGAIIPVAILAAIGRAYGVSLLASSVAFSKTAQSGDFAAALQFIVEYLWVAEHVLFVAWIAGFVAAVVLAARGRISREIVLWMGISVVLAIALAGPFMPAARHVRAVVPFLCLLTASVAVEVWRRRPGPGWVPAAAVVGLALQACLSFSLPLTQVFPREFRSNVEREFLPAAVSRDLGPYKIINAHFHHDPTWARVEPDRGSVVFRARHPLDFAPYLYEGYTAKQRAEFRGRDLSMRVVRLDAGGAQRADYPGPLQIRFQLPPGTNYSSEPFLTTGRAGVGDVLFVEYSKRFEDPNAVRIGHDHWGGGAITSDSIQIDRSRPHTLTVSAGSLFPPADHPFFKEHPDWLPLKSLLYVKLDDKVLLDTQREFHDAALSEILIGYNLIGASTAVSEFTAEILGLERLSPGAIISRPKAP